MINGKSHQDASWMTGLGKSAKIVKYLTSGGKNNKQWNIPQNSRRICQKPTKMTVRTVRLGHSIAGFN